MNFLQKNKISDQESQNNNFGENQTTQTDKEEKAEQGILEKESTREEMERGTLKNIRHRYMSSFTMHALNHIIEGMLPEKILWTFKLLAALGVAVHLAWNIFVAYFNYEVSTTIRHVPKMSMRLPMLYLCKDLYWGVLRNFYNCSYGNKHYNHPICRTMRQPYPYWYRDGSKNCRVNEEDISHPCVRVDPLLMNQCIVINPNLDKLQVEARTGKMSKTLTIWNGSNNYPFPLHVWISPVEAVWKFGPGSYWTNIDGPGKYEYSLEKTVIKRLPAPYSRPSCIEQGSKDALEKNLFIGPYTREKCEESCILKNQLTKCGVAYYFYRTYIRNKRYLKKFLNESISAEGGAKCWHRFSAFHKSIIRNCKASCYQPCEEERYRISETTHPWSAFEKWHQQRQKHHKNIKKVKVSVYYSELKEMEISERPSYDGVTLLANFGGMLGLMTGMSAISILEILLWVLLSIIACVKYGTKVRFCKRQANV